MWSVQSSKLLERPEFWLVYSSILCVYYIWSRRKYYLLSWKLPGPLALPIVGNCYIFLQKGIMDGFVHAMKLLEEFRSPNRLVRFWNGPEFWLMVGDAGVAFQINRMGLKPEVYKFLGGRYLEKGLVQETDLDHWRWVRKFCHPVFQFEILKSYLPLFHNESISSAQEFQEFANSGKSCMPLMLTGRYSMFTAFNALFGYYKRDVSECDRFHKSLYGLMEHFQYRFLVPAFRNNFIYWLCGMRRKEKKIMKTYLGFLQGLVDKKNQKLETNDSTDSSFVTQMLKAGIPHDEILIQSSTFLGASVDTTTIQNTVVLLMLALHPHVQNNMREEITRELGDDVTQVPSYDDIMKLDYLDRVLKECMRILPAGPFVAKKAYKDMTVTADDGEYNIPAGTMIAIFIYDIHNNPDYYENPKLFDPDRWLPENVTKRHPHCFLPFSSGPRNCIGYRYAKLQMKMFAITMVRIYDILPSEHFKTMDDVHFEFETTLKLKDNCQIKLRQRKSTSSPELIELTSNVETKSCNI